MVESSAAQPVSGQIARPQKSEAIIEDARQRARRRRIAAALVLAASLVVAAVIAVSGIPGDSSPGPVSSETGAGSASGGQHCLRALGLTQADSSTIPAGVDPCEVRPVAEPNYLGGFLKRPECADPTLDRRPTTTSPLLCRVVKAQELGLVVPGESLSNAELRDVVSRAVSNKGLSVRALSAGPLLEACLHKLGSEKPTLPSCEWALAHAASIQQALR